MKGQTNLKLQSTTNAIARIICRKEVLLAAEETCGSFKAAYGAVEEKALLDEIVERAWEEHLSTAKDIVAHLRRARVLSLSENTP